MKTMKNKIPGYNLLMSFCNVVRVVYRYTLMQIFSYDIFIRGNIIILYTNVMCVVFYIYNVREILRFLPIKISLFFLNEKIFFSIKQSRYYPIVLMFP